MLRYLAMWLNPDFQCSMVYSST